eukprot:403355542
MSEPSISEEEQVLCQQEASLCFWSLRFTDFYEALKGSMNKGILQKTDILKAFSKKFKFEVNQEHHKFVGAFEKKQQTNQAQEELVDHLYFLILFALPATIDQSHECYNQIQALQREMLKNAQTDKQNLQQKTLHTALGLRTRLIPVVGCTTSEIYIKAEMLRRCYGQKAPENQIKKVRFNCQTSTQIFQDDVISVKSERRPTHYKKYEPLIQMPSKSHSTNQNNSSKTQSSQNSSPIKLHQFNSQVQANSTTPQEITVDDENNGTREDSTTQSEDRHLKIINQAQKGNQFQLLDSPTDLSQNVKFSDNNLNSNVSNFPQQFQLGPYQNSYGIQDQEFKLGHNPSLNQYSDNKYDWLYQETASLNNQQNELYDPSIESNFKRKRSLTQENRGAQNLKNHRSRQSSNMIEIHEERQQISNAKIRVQVQNEGF